MSGVEVPAVRQVADYVWCDVRGSIHSSAAGEQSIHRHGGKELYDLYQDGELCGDEDHRPVYVLVQSDYDEFGPPLVLPRPAADEMFTLREAADVTAKAQP